MNQTTTPIVDDKVMTRGSTGKAIYGELLQFISAPAVLTFDGKPYDNSQAEVEYSFIAVDGRVWGFIEQPTPGFNTTWFLGDDDSPDFSSDIIAQAKNINVTSMTN